MVTFSAYRRSVDLTPLSTRLKRFVLDNPPRRLRPGDVNREGNGRNLTKTNVSVSTCQESLRLFVQSAERGA